MSGHVHRPDDPRVFVFGSNRLGIHGAGAALYACTQLGAEWGVGEGPTGRTYALPTCESPGQPLSLDEIQEHVNVFLAWARFNTEVRFFVSEVGCGIAGFTAEQIAPMFRYAAPNCDLPPSWSLIIDDGSVCDRCHADDECVCAERGLCCGDGTP